MSGTGCGAEVNDGAERYRAASDVLAAAERLVSEHRRQVSDAVAPLRVEAERVTREIDALRETARRKVWEAVVQAREIHARLCDAAARLEHLQLDIRERTGEVRLPSVPTPFAEFLLTEVRRFVVAGDAVSSQRSVALSGW